MHKKGKEESRETGRRGLGGVVRIREAGAECALRGGGRVGVRGEPLGEPWGLRWE